MPRPRKSEQAVIPSTALVASATRYPGKAQRIYMPRRDWQAECYRHYGICGEARFAAKFFGHSLSRTRLKAAHLEQGAAIIQEDGTTYDGLASLFNGVNGQAQMLEALGMHLTIAGECYVVGRSVDGVDLWEVISVLEMRVSGTNEWTIEYNDGEPPVLLTDSDVVIRIWLPAPGRQIEADSPFRSLLPILSEIEWLTRHVFAQISSRLAGAGILFLPQGMTFPPPPAGPDGAPRETANEADAFMLTLAESIMTPLDDPSSPHSLMPVIVTAPDEAIDKAKLMHFWSNLDENSMALRNEAIRRFALGMDLPPEQVLGMSSNGGTGGGTSNGVSHWGAWQIEEATIKLHIEPMLEVICNALTMGFLRPLLEDEANLTTIVYDSSALRLRPDRSKEAFLLYDRGLIKAEILLIENGFKKEDQPEDDEFKRWLLVKIASGSATPDQVQAALGELGVALPVTPLAEDQVPRETRPDPSLETHPTKPRMPEGASLLAASEALVFRAMERAGNRLRQAGGKVNGVPAYETHMHIKAGSPTRLLEDAWSCAPQVLAGIADSTTVIPVLNTYCEGLLAAQAPHTRAHLASALQGV